MPDSREDELREVSRQVAEWSRQFAESSWFARLSAVQKDHALAVIELVGRDGISYFGLRPERWNRGFLMECCLEIMPRKVTAKPDYFASIAPSLEAFFNFLAERSLLANARQLAETVAGLGEDIEAAASDPRNWGSAKSFTMQAQAADVDLGDRAALQRFMLEYNLRQLERMQNLPAPAAAAPGPVLSSKPSVGRNDPCPCGSGRKYKKCCGA